MPLGRQNGAISMEQIYTYLDYRHYLRDFYEGEKSKRASYSLRLFGRIAEIDASYLSKVMKEQRHLGVQYIVGLVKALRLTEAEADYFENLVHFNRSTAEDQKQHYFELLLRLRRPHTHSLTAEQYEFYTKWYYTALRNLLEFYSFAEGGDYQALGEQLSPAITPQQAKRSVELLSTLGLIEPDEEGFFKLTEAAISTGDEWWTVAVRTFQRETIHLSEEALERHEAERRDISSVTMNITEREFDAIRDMLRKFRSSVIHYANEVEQPDRIYQLNLQLIPLSEPPALDQKDA